jgi:hypothetical protein
MPIGRDEVIPTLLAAAPGFHETWQRHLAWWKGEERGLFADASEVAGYVVESYAEGDTRELPALFAALERILQDGDEAAREAATRGVLEDIQTLASHRPFGPAVFERLLGPRTRRAWDEVDRLWRAGGGSLAGVIRLELRARPERGTA